MSATKAAKRMSTAGELADWLATQPRDRRVVIEVDPDRGHGYTLAAAGEELHVPEAGGQLYGTGDLSAPAYAERVVAITYVDES